MAIVKSRPKKSNATKAMDAHIRKVAKAAIVQQVEHKLVAYHSAATAIPTTGVILGMTDIPQATTAQTDTLRVGDQVRPLRLKINMMINNTSSTVPDKTRITLIKWHGRFGLDPASFAKLFLGSPYTIAEYNVDTGPNRMRQFTVLHDKWVDNPCITLATTGPTQQGYQLHQIDVKCQGTINWVAASSTDCSGGYYLMCSSWQGLAQYELYSLLTFMDA